MSINPFCPIKPHRTIQYYIFWVVSLILSPILVPIRILLLLFICPFNTVVMNFVTKNVNTKKPLSSIREMLLQTFTRIGGKFFLSTLGVRIVERDEQKRPTPETTNMLIFNHTSSLDPVILEIFNFASFVSKSEVAKMPVFGASAKANECIFLERGKEGDADRVFDEICRRTTEDVHQLGYPRRFPPLCISPEGTVCNGTALLPFKRGAFAHGQSVEMCSIVWDQRYGNWLGEYAPTELETTDWSIYAENVRDLYSEAIGIPKSEYQPYDKEYYAGKAHDYQKCSEAWKRDHTEQDRVYAPTEMISQKQD